MHLPQRGLPALRGTWLRFSGWLLCGNALLMLLLGTAYLRDSPAVPDWAERLFTALMFIGQFSTIALVFQLPLFAAAAIWPRRWLMLPLSIALGTLMVAGIALDVVVYSQYRLHIDASILQLVFGGAGGAIFVFSPGLYAKCGLVVLCIVAIQWVQARSAEWCAARPRRVKGWVIGACLMIAVLAENGIFAWADAAGYSPVLGQGDLLPLYHPVRCRDCFAHFGIQSEHVPGAVSAGGTFHYPMEPVVCRLPARRMNILFLLIDSWRFDALSDRATPHIAEFARQSIVFTQHFSGGSATRSGIFSLMYGIPPTYWPPTKA